ncbi:MAG TPA: hypothetical protein VH351_14400 [Bryobacteraceae bacterium]|jgi:uncharacterized membrane protein|nr:hypothetical protein [Bryobacteraceae bacterium]
MGFKIASGGALLLALLSLLAWRFVGWATIYLSGFFFFIAVLLFLISVFGRRGSSVWRSRGQG